MEAIGAILPETHKTERKRFVHADESALVEALKKGDKQAYKYLYKQYAGLFFTIARRYAPSSESAEDLMQEAFIQIFRKVSSFRGEGSFEGWMKRLVVNRCLTELKRKRVFTKDIDDPTTVEEPGLASISLTSLHAEDILKAFEHIPVGARTVLNLYAIEGLDHKEIAHELGISESASRSQLTKARSKLRQVLQSQNLI